MNITTAHTDTAASADIIPLGCWEITDAAVAEYLAAVGDALPVYRQAGIAPPLLLAARVVGILLERLDLPAGAIHSLQDVTVLAPARIGARVQATAQVEPTRERGGMRFLTVNYTISELAAANDDAGSVSAGSSDLMRGRTTVLLPVPSSDA